MSVLAVATLYAEHLRFHLRLLPLPCFSRSCCFLDAQGGGLMRAEHAQTPARQSGISARTASNTRPFSLNLRLFDTSDASGNGT